MIVDIDLFLSSPKSALQKDYVTGKNVLAQTKNYKNYMVIVDIDLFLSSPKSALR